jgi:hypothetical protein
VCSSDLITDEDIVAITIYPNFEPQIHLEPEAFFRVASEAIVSPSRVADNDCVLRIVLEKVHLTTVADVIAEVPS